jgi:hypothetical protein
MARFIHQCREQETFEQIAFVVQRIARCKTISNDRLLVIKFVLEQCVRFDVPAITRDALEAVKFLAENNIDFIEILCAGNNFVRMCISGLQNGFDAKYKQICL